MTEPVKRRFDEDMEKIKNLLEVYYNIVTVTNVGTMSDVVAIVRLEIEVRTDGRAEIKKHESKVNR